jgi:hypothetical protein
MILTGLQNAVSSKQLSVGKTPIESNCGIKMFSGSRRDDKQNWLKLSSVVQLLMVAALLLLLK